MPRPLGDRTLRVAVVGAGTMANRVHYPSLASFTDVQIAAICDIDVQRLQTTADRYGIAARYTDYRRMVEDVAPDAIYVIGQPHIMYDVWIWCLEQGLNLYIEKPLGITLHQARALAYLAARHDCITQVSFQRRSTPLVTMLRDECLKRGPVVHAVCRFYKCAMAPFLGARDHMMDDGVHAIDTLRWICGGEVSRVDSVTRSVGAPDTNLIVAMLHFSSGATGLMVNSWSSGRRIFSVEIHAPGICAEAEQEGRGTSTRTATRRAWPMTRARSPAATSFLSTAGSKPRTGSSSTACRRARCPHRISGMLSKRWK